MTLRRRLGAFAVFVGCIIAGALPSRAQTFDLPRNLGVVIPWSADYLTELDAFSQKVGAAPKIVGSYRDWTIDLINPTLMDGVIARGAIPQVTWEPWDPTLGTNQPAYALSTITNGVHDAYIRASAAAAAAYGKPFQLRFAPEMNGSWAPWEGTINGNTPAQYVAAWQHVVSIFRAAGAMNVTWVWAPNHGPTGTIASYYPGDSWVDVLGIDGYNWGSADVWQTFTQVFGAAYDIVASLNATKPVMITETGSNEAGGDKAAWITSAYLTEIPTRFPRVTGVIWFDVNKEVDWRIDSSSASLAAYQAVAASPSWGGSGGTTATLAAPVLSVVSAYRKSIALAWSTVAGASGYTLELATTAEFALPIVVVTSGTSLTQGGLASGTTYYLRIRATSATDSSAWSATVSTTTTGRKR